MISFIKSKIFPILLVNFLGILGYSLMLPILIFIVSDFGGNGFLYGLIGAMYPFFQLIGAPRLGKLSDRIGRKKVLIITQLGSFLAWSLFLVAFFIPNIPIWSQETIITGKYVMTLPLLLLFVARLIDGFTGGNISVANAYISDISTDEDRSKNFGLIGTSTSLGLAVGPAVSAVLAATFLGTLLPLTLAALAALLTAYIINKRLTESNPCVGNSSLPSFSNLGQLFKAEKKDCYEEKEQGARNNWNEILAIKGIPTMYLLYFLTYLALNLFTVVLPIYTASTLHWTVAELGIFLAYYSFVTMIAQGPILSKVANYINDRSLMLTGALLLATGFALLTGKTVLVLYIAVSIMALGNGILWPSFLALLSTMGPASRRGAIQGYGASMGSMASIIGLILGGALFDFLGTTVFIIGAGIFLVIAVILGLAFFSIHKKQNSKASRFSSQLD
ncbi:MAG: MFS transporter [Bacteroidota bacterium]